MLSNSSSQTHNNEIVNYYSGLGTDELIALYKKSELTDYVIYVIAEILQRRDIDTDKIDNILKNPLKKTWQESFLDSIGFVGFVFGIVAPLLCALYECYVWAISGKWPGYSTQDLLRILGFNKNQSVNFYFYLQNWPDLSNLINHVVGFVMNLSLILTLGLIGFIIFEFVDLLHTTINKKRNFKPKK